MEGPVPAARVRFGAFELDRRSGELLKGGTRVRLQEGPLRVLQALLDRPGEIVTREELQRRLWPDDTFVDFANGLNSAVNRLRSSLGDNAEKPRFVETVGRRGYRFIAPLGSREVIAEPSAAATPSSAATRLAVLPFRQLKADAETEFLVFSLADAIAASLSGLESIAVRSPIAAARFASEPLDLATIMTALDVNLVLAGTVLRVDDRVRVSTQLVEAPRGTLLWTATADASLEDLFRVSEGLVRRIVESLALPLTVRDARQIDRDVPHSGRAYELYLRGIELGRYPDTWPQARDLFLDAVRLDPQYAPAWARLGRTYRLLAKYASDEEPQLIRSAEDAFRRALGVNPELSLAHALYAQLEMETGRSIEAFTRLLGRVQERRVDAQLFGGLVHACRYVGLLEASHAAHERAKRIDPTIKTSVGYTSLMRGEYARAALEARENDDPLEGFVLALAGRADEATRTLHALRPRHGSNRVWGAFLELVLAFARKDEAALVSWAERLLQLPFSDPEGIFSGCLVLAQARHPTLAIEMLRRSVAAGFACPIALGADPAMQRLHAEPAFGELREEVDRRYQRALAIFEAAGGLDMLT